MARVLKKSHSFNCTPRAHPLTEWTIPAFSFPAEDGTHLPTPERWKAGLALATEPPWSSHYPNGIYKTSYSDTIGTLKQCEASLDPMVSSPVDINNHINKELCYYTCIVLIFDARSETQ